MKTKGNEYTVENTFWADEMKLTFLVIFRGHIDKWKDAQREF